MRRPTTEGSCIKDVAEHFKGGITTFADVHVFQSLSAKFFHETVKNIF